jgi:pimeloyl-ACP methyl ester carboxylesterase
MSHVLVNGVRLWVEDSGGDHPPLVFSHGLLWSSRMFDAQVSALRGRYRCIAWDHRGQGGSDVPPGRAPITVEECYADGVELIERLGVGPVHFVGLSMGGFVGMRLAARRPDLVRSLVLLETSADPEPAEHVARYRRLAGVVRWLGPVPVASRVMPIMFGRTFLTDPARAEDRELWRAQLARNRRSIARAVLGVVERDGVYGELSRITAPTLVVVGSEDAATAPARSERLAAAIPGAQLTVVPAAGHSSTVEQPDRVTALLAEFLAEVRTAAPAGA